jgi:transposase
MSPQTHSPAPSFLPAREAEAGLRLRRPNRDGVVPIPAFVDGLVPADHLVRKVWAVVTQLDLSAFCAPLAVTTSSPGRPAIDPQLLVALWVYALSQGVIDGRVIARLCLEHLAYMWLCGGVTVNAHTLNDFRVQHEAALEALLTQVVTRLTEAGWVGWETQAQDGMRVRASAGAASFHRQPTLEKHWAAAQTQVAVLEATASPVAEAEPLTPRAQAARARAAQDRASRLEAALAELPAVRATKPADERGEARVSSTDPKARVMKMGDGGFRPAYNWQFASDVLAQVIVGVDVTNHGSDKGEMDPMLRQLQRRYGRLPEEWLIDGGFVKLTDFEAWASSVQILAPVPQPKNSERDPHRPLPDDSPVIAAWRERMGTAAAKERYKLRAATAECVNAQARAQHGVLQSGVRGIAKNRCLALWVAITHNLLIWIRKLGDLLVACCQSPPACTV